MNPRRIGDWTSAARTLPALVMLAAAWPLPPMAYAGAEGPPSSRPNPEGAASAAVQPARAEGSAPVVASSDEERVGPVKLRDVGIDQILELLERWTGKALLRPQALPVANLSLTIRQEVPRSEAIRAIETLLSLNGIAVTALDENFLKITPVASAKSEAPELIAGSTLELPPSGRIAAKLFRLKFLRVTEFVPQIAGMLNAGTSTPAVFEKANAALITDSITNLQRVEALMLQLDRASPSGLEPRFYPLRFAKASDVVTKLHAILTGAPQAQLGTITTYSADDRTNQIVLFCDPAQYGVFDKLIGRLDVKSGQDTRNEIIFLNHAAAKDVATILTQLISGQNGNHAGQDAVRTGANAAATTAAVAPDSAGTASPLTAIARDPVNQFSPLLTILPEERSNSVVVSGTEDDIRLIRDLVNRIDVLLAQVRIEVVIAEVDLSNDSTTGISALGLKVEGDKLVGFSGSLPGVGVTDGVITRAGGDTTVSGPWDLAAVISLASTPRKNNATILSVPNIITTHNREGKIFVGEERPVISSYLNDAAGATSTPGTVGTGYRTTINSKDIGISLSVKPLIGIDGSVQLDIKQEVNDVLGEITIDGNPQPRIGRRSTESFVSARSGDIIVLGGLQRSSQSRSTSRLGPIPIVGDILGTRTREKTRTDLIFFLRPTVLTNPVAADPTAPDLSGPVKEFPKAQRRELERLLRPPKGS